jgi:hypothetical protein
MTTPRRSHVTNAILRSPLALATAVLLWSATLADAQVPWRSATSADRANASAADVLRQAADNPAERHVVVELRALPDAAQQQALRTEGLELLSYLGNNAYFAAVRADARVEALTDARGLKAASRIAREHKLAPPILAGEYPDYARGTHPDTGEVMIAAYVIFHRDVPLSEALALARRHGGAVVDTIGTLNGAVIELPEAALGAVDRAAAAGVHGDEQQQPGARAGRRCAGGALQPRRQRRDGAGLRRRTGAESQRLRRRLTTHD